MRINSYTKHHFSLYIAVLITIYLTDSLMFATNSDPIFMLIKRIGLIIFTAIWLMFYLREAQFKVSPYMLLLSVSIIFSAFLAGRFFDGYSYYTMVALLWFAYIFSNKFTVEEFSHAFCSIMRIIAIVSIVCWLFSNIIQSISMLPTITNTNGNIYKNLFLTVIPMRGSLARRNLGPFWEPGAYQVYLSVALFFTMFVEKRKQILIDTILFVVALLSTLSGIVMIPILLLTAAYFFEHKNIKAFMLTLFAVCLLTVLMGTGTFDEIVSKISSDAETNSFTYRWIGIEGGLKGFLKNPLFGSSPEVNEEIKRNLAIKYLGSMYSSNANTFFNYLAYYGIFVGGFMWLSAFRFFKRVMHSRVSCWLAFLAFIASTSNENMMASLLVVVLIFLKRRSVNDYCTD